MKNKKKVSEKSQTGRFYHNVQGLALLSILINYLWMMANLEEGDWKSGFQRLKLDRKSHVMMIKITSSQTNNKCKIIHIVMKKPQTWIPLQE